MPTLGSIGFLETDSIGLISDAIIGHFLRNDLQRYEVDPMCKAEQFRMESDPLSDLIDDSEAHETFGESDSKGDPSDVPGVGKYSRLPHYKKESGALPQRII